MPAKTRWRRCGEPASSGWCGAGHRPFAGPGPTRTALAFHPRPTRTAFATPPPCTFPPAVASGTHPGNGVYGRSGACAPHGRGASPQQRRRWAPVPRGRLLWLSKLVSGGGERGEDRPQSSLAVSATGSATSCPRWALTVCPRGRAPLSDSISQELLRNTRPDLACMRDPFSPVEGHSPVGRRCPPTWVDRWEGRATHRNYSV